VAVSGQRVMVLRTFVKKTEATPRREMEIAFARLKEVRE
jgi:phage-related protein